MRPVQIEPETHHQGSFEGYNILGTYCQNAAGEVSWLIHAWEDDNPAHGYWLSNGDFLPYEAAFGAEALGPVVVNPEERAAILKAITAWLRKDGN